MSWDPVEGAAEYHVYYRADGGNWNAPVAAVTGTTYDFPASLLQNGTGYSFTVRAFAADGTASAFVGRSYGVREQYPQACAILDQIGWNLQAAENWAAGCSYVTMSTTLSSREYADYTFTRHAGNCYGMAAAVYEMARAMGYDAHQMTGYVPLRGGSMGPHSWVEVVIDGVTYLCDPDFQHETGRNGYLIHYGQSGTWRYSNYSRMN